MSASWPMGTRVSGTAAVPLQAGAQDGKAFLEIQRRDDTVQIQSELHHRDRDFRLNPDDDRLRAAQPGGMSDAADGARGERIEHVERRQIDDHAPTSKPSDALGEVFSE